MRLFISYSTPDLDIVREIANALSHRAQIDYWDGSKVPGQGAWSTIYKWIDSADLVLVVVTGSTVARAMPVGQEIGRARAKGKLIIPLVASEVPRSELGCLGGITYLPIDRDSLADTMGDLEAALLNREAEILRGRWTLGITFAVLALLRLMLPEEED